MKGVAGRLTVSNPVEIGSESAQGRFLQVVGKIEREPGCGD